MDEMRFDLEDGRKTEDTNGAAGTDSADQKGEASIEFGTWLKSKREAVRVPLEEIAAITKVHITQLKMIEENHWESLPAPAFVRGFLLCYARHLGLDEDEVLRRYRKSLGKGELNQFRSTTTTNEGPSPDRPRVMASPNFKSSPAARDLDKIRPPILTPKRVLFGALLIGLIGLVSFLISVGKSESRKEAIVTERKAQTAAPTTAPTPTETPAVGAGVQGLTTTPTTETGDKSDIKDPHATAVSTDKKNEAALAPGEPVKLAIKAVEQTWVSVRIDNQESKGQVLKAGTRLPLEAKSKIELVLSNAGAIEIEYKGKRNFPPGFRGDVVKMTFPADAVKLKEKPVTARQPILPGKPPAVTAPGATTPVTTDIKPSTTPAEVAPPAPSVPAGE